MCIESRNMLSLSLNEASLVYRSFRQVSSGNRLNECLLERAKRSYIDYSQSVFALWKRNKVLHIFRILKASFDVGRATFLPSLALIPATETVAWAYGVILNTNVSIQITAVMFQSQKRFRLHSFHVTHLVSCTWLIATWIAGPKKEAVKQSI